MEPPASVAARTDPTPGTSDHFRERLHAPWWAWSLPIAAAVVMGAAYGFALGLVAGVLAAAVAGAVGAWLIVRSAILVRVDDSGLHVGRANLPPEAIGDVRALTAEQTTAALGARADANAFLAARGAYSPLSVAVAVADPRDPHPYWLISTRSPEALASAIMAIPGRPRP